MLSRPRPDWRARVCLAAMSLLDYLEQSAAQLTSLKVLGFPAMAILHATCVAWAFRRTALVNKMAPLTALVATWILSFGGTTLTGRPSLIQS